MKILNVISSPAIGGTETFLLSITTYLEKMGCEIDIINTWRNSLMKKAALEANLSYKELDGSSRYIRLRNLAQITGIIRRSKYDVVQAFGLRVSILLRLLKPFYRGRSIPLITGLRVAGVLRDWHHTWLDRLTQRKCDLFIPNSDAVAQMFTTRERLARDKMVVIKNGINTSDFDAGRFQNITRHSLGLPRDKVIITTVANLRHQKGYDFYVEIIREFLKEFDNVHFVWIGKGSLKSELENSIRSIGASDKITFMGMVKDVRPVLSCSDIFVLPSRDEGMPRALMEAMAMSLPCLATDVGGVNEVIEHGLCGLIANFGDVEIFGRYLTDLIEDGNLRCNLGQAARRRIAENFNMEKIAAKYMKLFELVVAGYRNGKEIQKQIDD